MSESWLEHVLRRAKPEMADECGSSRERLALLENNDDVGAAVATWPLVVLSPCECHAREGVVSHEQLQSGCLCGQHGREGYGVSLARRPW